MSNKLTFTIGTENTPITPTSPGKIDAEKVLQKFDADIQSFRQQLEASANPTDDAGDLPQVLEKRKLEAEISTASAGTDVTAQRARIDALDKEISQIIADKINDRFSDSFVITTDDFAKFQSNRQTEIPVYFKHTSGGTTTYEQISANVLTLGGDIDPGLQLFFNNLFTTITQHFSDYTFEHEDLIITAKAQLEALHNEWVNAVDEQISQLEVDMRTLGFGANELEIKKKQLVQKQEQLKTVIAGIPTVVGTPTQAVDADDQSRLNILLNQQTRLDQMLRELYEKGVYDFSARLSKTVDQIQAFQFTPNSPENFAALDISSLTTLQKTLESYEQELQKYQTIMENEPDLSSELTLLDQMRKELIKIIDIKTTIFNLTTELRTLTMIGGRVKFAEEKSKKSDPYPKYNTFDDVESAIVNLRVLITEQVERLHNAQGALTDNMEQVSKTYVDVRRQKDMLELQNEQLWLRNIDPERYKSNRGYREQTDAYLIAAGYSETGEIKNAKQGAKVIKEGIGKNQADLEKVAKVYGNEVNKSLVEIHSPGYEQQVDQGMQRVAEFVNVDGTLTDAGQKLYTALQAKEATAYPTIIALNTAYGSLIRPQEMDRLSAGYNKMSARELQDLATMTPYKLDYLIKYTAIMNDMTKNAADKVYEATILEARQKNLTRGTSDDRLTVWKNLKDEVKNEKKLLRQMQAVLTLQIEKEWLEAVNTWATDYSKYLASYGQPNAFLVEPPAYPNIEQVYTDIINTGGPLAEALVASFELPNGGKGVNAPAIFREKLFSIRNGKVGVLAKAYDPYADVLYGAPINQPAQVVNKSGNAVPGAEYNDHEQQKLEREKAETPYLMTKFWRKVRSMEMGTTKDLGRGSTPILQEIGRRHLASIDGYNFYDATQQMIDELKARMSGTATGPDGEVLQPLEPDERDLLARLESKQGANPKGSGLNDRLDHCVKSLIDIKVVADIQEQYVIYRDKDYRTQEQLISLFFVNAVVGVHKLPPTQAEHVKIKLTELRGGGFHNKHNGTEGNPAVGVMVKQYIEAGDPNTLPPTGLNLGKDRLNESLGWKSYFVDANGNFRGVPGAIKLGFGNLAKTLGVPEKHIPTVTAYATAAVAIWGGSLAWQFVFGYLLKPGTSFGEKARKMGVTILGLGAGLPLLTGSDLGEWRDRTVNGGKEGENIIKFGKSPLGKMLGAEDPESMDLERTEPKEVVVDIFGNVQLADLSKYLTFKTGTILGGQAGFEMTEAQYEAFKADPSIIPFAKDTLEILVKSKPTMEEVSKFINIGLHESGITHDRYPSIVQDPVLKTKTVSQFQVDRVKFDTFSQGAISSLVTDVTQLEELFYLYEAWSPAEQQQFEERIEQMQDFETRRKEIYPYLRYNFLQYRQDLFDDVTPPLTATGSPNDQTILLNGLGNRNLYMQTVMYDYLKGTDATNNPLNTMPMFEAYFSKVLVADDPECKAFLNTYLFSSTALTDLKQIGNTASSGIDKMVADCDIDTWNVGQAGPNSTRQEILMTNIPGCKEQSEEAFLHVTPAGSFSVWVKDVKDNVWKEYKLKSIGVNEIDKDFTVSQIYKSSTLRSNNQDLFALSVKRTDGKEGRINFQESVLGNMVDQLKTGEHKFKVEKSNMTTQRVDPSTNAVEPVTGMKLQELEKEARRRDPVVNLATGVAQATGGMVSMIPFIGPIANTIRSTVASIEQDIQDISHQVTQTIKPETTIRFEPTGNSRAEW